MNYYIINFWNRLSSQIRSSVNANDNCLVVAEGDNVTLSYDAITELEPSLDNVEVTRTNLPFSTGHGLTFTSVNYLQGLNILLYVAISCLLG